MKYSILVTNILPLADFKKRASEVINAQKEHKRPLVITQNGRAAAVLITPEEYDSLLYRVSLIESIEKGMADEKSGNVIQQADLAAELAIRYGKR